MNIEWESSFNIQVNIDETGAVVINANKEGLLSLSKQLAVLAGEEKGSHIHYDKYNSLEEGSVEMIICKI